MVQAGPKNGKWRGGVCLNEKGYRRITSGKHRNKYEHRRVIEKLLEFPISYMFHGDGKIPEGMTVEHLDHIRTHNCCGNLMLLEKTIHDRISIMGQRYYREHWNDPPDWTTNDEWNEEPEPLAECR